MLLVTWLFDKLGYMPKIAVETNWPFPAVEKPYTPHEFEQPIKKPVAKMTTKKSTRKKKA